MSISKYERICKKYNEYTKIYNNVKNVIETKKYLQEHKCIQELKKKL